MYALRDVEALLQLLGNQASAPAPPSVCMGHSAPLGALSRFWLGQLHCVITTC